MNKDEQKKDKGNKFDYKKLRLDLLPLDALMGVAATFTYGSIKYGDWNWSKGLTWSRVFGALLRHLFAFWCGEEIDKESGLYHIDQANFCGLILSTFAKNPDKYKNFDDRPVRMKNSMQSIFKLIDDNFDTWLKNLEKGENKK